MLDWESIKIGIETPDCLTHSEDRPNSRMMTKKGKSLQTIPLPKTPVKSHVQIVYKSIYLAEPIELSKTPPRRVFETP
jgi:hypothetical protein